jgi:hypothetical protein
VIEIILIYNVVELFPQLPAYCLPTLTPVYNPLTYDVDQMAPYAIYFNILHLEQHVKQAIDNNTLIWRSKSAAAGLWDSLPLPTFPPIKEMTVRLEQLRAQYHQPQCKQPQE